MGKLKRYCINALHRAIQKRIGDRPCDIIIDKDYMERWYLIPRNRFFNIYYHHFYGSDAPVPHDHPWVSLSVILDGKYLEHTPKGCFERHQGAIKCRGPKALHWIEIDQPVRTLFITGPRLRRWGFQCQNRWVDFEEYIANRGDNRLANGCGEFDAPN